jgi:hypothetical protein
LKIFTLACLNLVLVAFAFASVQAEAQQYVPGEVIVRLKGDSQSSESYAFLGKAHYSKAMDLKESWTGMNMYHFKVGKGQSVEQTVADLRKDASVLYAEPNYIFSKASDTGLHQRFSADEIQAASLDNSAQAVYMATGAPIGVQNIWSTTTVPAVKPIVAVIDTGLDTTHFVVQQSGALWRNLTWMTCTAGTLSTTVVPCTMTTVTVPMLRA